jgi:hypothetical protein
MTTSVDPAAPAAPPVVGAVSPRCAVRCVVCRRPFDFAAGEAAVVLRHTAYGYDFAHEGPCLASARDLLFVEPGYDRAAFGRDAERRRVLAAADAVGWAAVVAETPERVLAGRPVRFEPLRWWALVEHRDGTRRVEGVVRAEDWLDEPGGAEFPAGAAGRHRGVGYAAPGEQADPARLAGWDALVRARCRTEEGSVGAAGLPARPAT